MNVSNAGSNYYVRILSTIDRELLKPNASVALHKHSNALVDVLPPEADSSIMMLTSGDVHLFFLTRDANSALCLQGVYVFVCQIVVLSAKISDKYETEWANKLFVASARHIVAEQMKCVHVAVGETAIGTGS